MKMDGTEPDVEDVDGVADDGDGGDGGDVAEEHDSVMVADDPLDEPAESDADSI
jgi:hypothetical protein